MLRRHALLAIAALPLWLTCAAGELRELPVRGIGFIGPIVGRNSPETAVCGNLSYPSSVGFPYLNRSIVVDLGEPRLVHQLRMLDDLKDSGGTAPTIAESGLLIYTSNDGRTYARYPGNFRITIRSGKPEGVFDVVTIEGLAIFARYIKLHADRRDEKWDFASNNLQTMVKAYQDSALSARILSVAMPRYSAGTGRLDAQVEMPEADVGRLILEVEAKSGGPLAKIEVAPTGACTGDVAVGSLPVGLHEFATRVVTHEGTPLALAHVRTFVVAALLHNPAAASPVVGKPGQAVMLADLGRYAESPATNWSEATFRRGGRAAAEPLRVAEKGAAAVSVTLPARGWHAVSIGMVGGDSQVDARLGAQGSFRRCRLEVWRQHEKATGLGEAFVGCADLSDTTLCLKPVGRKPCRLAFVRLLGMSEEQVRLVLAARKPKEAKSVSVNNDGFSMFFSGMDSKERLHRMIDLYADKRLYSYDYCLGSDASCTYDTKVGSIFGAGLDKFWRQGDKRAHDNVHKFIAEGNDPLRVVIERCRENGMRVHASFRMNANYPPPMAKTFNGDLYWKHYDCRITSRHGRRSYRLSYAFPQVRAFRLAIIKEAIGYNPDGIHLDFLRHPPFLGYDKPLLDAFQKKYGVDPLKVPEDERWQGLCAEVMTGFVRDVRSALDAAGKAQGRHLTLSASFDYCNYAAHALDVERWVRDGLVDNISPGLHGLGGIYFSVAPFAKMARGTRCELFPRLEHTVKGHDPTPESERGEVKFESEHMTLNRYKARALDLYDEGAQGFYLFNTSGLPFIDAMSDIEGLRAWNAFERPLVGWFEDAAVSPR